MASERRRGRRGEAPEDDVPVGEPAEAGHETAHDLGGKSKGGAPKKSAAGFPGPLPILVGLAAGVLAFVGAFVMESRIAPADPYESLDAGGIQAARLMGALDIDRWNYKFGSAGAIRRKVLEETTKRKKEAQLGEDKDLPAFEDALARWYLGNPSGSGVQWRPGFDAFFPAKSSDEDEQLKLASESAISSTQEGALGAFVGAMIKTGPTEALIAFPQDMPAAPGGKLVKTVDQTQVYDTNVKGKAVRWYEQPMRNRLGSPAGSCVVILSTASVHPVSILPAAGAAAGLALLGAFVATLALTAGTRNALAHLAHDVDALARGHLDTKVTVAGPVVVQQIAKNAQKLAAIAQSGTAAPAQVMVQEIVRAPVQEINEALAPSKSFQRPEELEVEATQKISAELGNDYYDVVNVDQDHVGVFIADIPAHGVKSSMHMASIRTLFRANAKGQTSPAEVLKAVNRSFAIDLPRGVYVTAMYAIVNKTTGICKVASAQHLPLVFWKLSRKASARLSPEGIALGLDPGPVFDKTLSEKAVQLEKGDRIVLFTDGAINAKNGAGAQYGEEKFYYVVNREAPKNSAACVNFVANDVDLFHEGAPLTDDFTLVTLRKLR